MNSNKIKCCYNLKNNFSKFFAEYKFLICLSFLFLVVGFVVGAVIITKNSGDVELNHLIDAGLIDVLTGDKTGMGLFFTHFLGFCCCFCLLIVCNFKPWLNCFACFVLLVRGYIAGFDATILILTFGLAGVFNVVLIILPCELLVWCVLSLVFAVKTKKNKITKKYGCNNVNYANVCCVFFCVATLFLFLRCLMLPLMRVTIIVS